MKEETAYINTTGDSGLEIFTLGQFLVRRGNSLLSRESTRSYRLWELFKYLITNRDKEIYSETILENLWPEQDYSDPRHTIRTLIYRLRRLLDTKSSPSPSCISFSHGAYSWNSAIAYWLDAEAFEELCLKARNTSDSDPEQAIMLYKTAIGLYRGDYLPELAYSEWVIPVRNYYHRLYIQCILDITELLKESHRFPEIIQICEKAFLIEFFEEEFHLRFLNALIKEDKLRQARAHYDYMSTVFYRELGVKPSVAARELYRLTFKNQEEPDLDLLSVQESLVDKKGSEGAFFCDPEVFRFLYKLELRRVERTGQSVFLAMLTLAGKDSKTPDANILKETMTLLQGLVVSSLRRGDVLTRWNETQLLIILPGLNFEQAETVLDRIGHRFIALKPQNTLLLHRDIKPVSEAHIQVG